MIRLAYAHLIPHWVSLSPRFEQPPTPINQTYYHDTGGVVVIRAERHNAKPQSWSPAVGNLVYTKAIKLSPESITSSGQRTWLLTHTPIPAQVLPGFGFSTEEPSSDFYRAPRATPSRQNDFDSAICGDHTEVAHICAIDFFSGEILLGHHFQPNAPVTK